MKKKQLWEVNVLSPRMPLYGTLSLFRTSFAGCYAFHASRSALTSALASPISSCLSELFIWKVGHANDNSSDSENVAGAYEPSVPAHFIFRFENGLGNQSFFSTHDQNTVQPQARPTFG